MINKIKWHDSCHIKALILFIIWVVIFGGGLYLVGNVLGNIGLFFLVYNMLYPIANIAVCGFFTRKNGFVWWLPFSMVIVASVSFIFTDLMRYALPNVIVTTIITVFFSCGIGSALHGKRIKEDKKTKKSKYKSIIDD